jgi:hypothetical protein
MIIQVELAPLRVLCHMHVGVSKGRLMQQCLYLKSRHGKDVMSMAAATKSKG